MSLSLSQLTLRRWHKLGIGIVLFLVLLRFLPAPALVQTEGFSQAVYDNHGKLLRLTLSPDDKYRLWVPLKEIEHSLVDATLTYEDQYFYYHPGFNPAALVKAAWKTYVVGNRAFGASTITMQLARIRFQLETTTITGKLWQIFRAVELEWAWR